MNEPAKRKRPGVWVIAAVLVLPAFGGGLFVGKVSVEGAPEQKPSVVDEGAELATDDAASIELAVCQRKLARRKKNRATPLAMDGGPAETERDAGTEARTIEVVQKEITSCKRSATLHGAELCRSVRLHLDALLGLPKNDVLCVQRVRVADYIEDDFEKCAAFMNAPADVEGYSDEERKTIMDAVEVAKTLDEDRLAELLNGVHQGCYGMPRTNSP